VTHSLRHVVPSVKRKLRNAWHPISRSNFVVRTRDTLEINFWTFQNFCHDMARTTSPDPHRHASPRTLSRVGTPNCVPWRKPLVVLVWSFLSVTVLASSNRHIVTRCSSLRLPQQLRECFLLTWIELNHVLWVLPPHLDRTEPRIVSASFSPG